MMLRTARPHRLGRSEHRPILRCGAQLMHEFDEDVNQQEERAPDPQEGRAIETLRDFFARKHEEVFSSRQVEVITRESSSTGLRIVPYGA